MATVTEEELQRLVRAKVARQIQLETAKVEAEIKETAEPKRRFRLKHAGKFIGANLAAFAVVATAIVGVFSYRDGLREQRRTRFNSLVQRMVEHKGPDIFDVQITMSTLAAIRQGYSTEPGYASEVAFLVMPYVFEGKDREQLRLLAARTLAEAITANDDVDEQYRLNETFLERQKFFDKNPDDMTELFQRYSMAVVCSLVNSAYRLNVPERPSRDQCQEWEKQGYLPFKL